MDGSQVDRVASRELELCSQDRALNTTYNGDLEVPPYTGIMFEVYAFSNVEILTLELDVRLENAADFSVEVYSLEGAYTNDNISDRLAWKQLASTELVLAPEGNGAVVPAADFMPVSIAANGKRSFYVTMKGPHLDHTVNALQKRGEVYIRGDDLQLMVGTGLTSYSFPKTADTVLAPKFAGIVHYRKEFDCDDAKASTTVADYPIVFEKEDGDSSLPSTIQEAANRAMDGLLETNAQLKSYVDEFGLQKIAPVTRAINYQYACPDDWTECPSSYLDTKISFVHKGGLDSGILLYELYKSTSAIVDTVEREVGAKSLYFGYESASAAFSLALTGVPAGVTMDEVQTDYFRSIFEQFLTKTAKDTTTVFYDVQVDGQLASDGRLRRSLASKGTTELRGVVRGGVAASVQSKEFRFAVDMAFRRSEKLFIALLTQSGARPGQINEEQRFDFFRGISDVKSKISASDLEIEASNTKPVVGLVCGSLGGIFFMVGLVLLFRHIKNSKRRSNEVAEYREAMRAQRRALREQKEYQKSDEVKQESKLTVPAGESEDRKSVGSTDSSTESATFPKNGRKPVAEVAAASSRFDSCVKSTGEQQSDRKDMQSNNESGGRSDVSRRGASSPRVSSSNPKRAPPPPPPPRKCPGVASSSSSGPMTKDKHCQSKLPPKRGQPKGRVQSAGSLPATGPHRVGMTPIPASPRVERPQVLSLSRSDKPPENSPKISKAQSSRLSRSPLANPAGPKRAQSVQSFQKTGSNIPNTPCASSARLVANSSQGKPALHQKRGQQKARPQSNYTPPVGRKPAQTDASSCSGAEAAGTTLSLGAFSFREKEKLDPPNARKPDNRRFDDSKK